MNDEEAFASTGGALKLKVAVKEKKESKKGKKKKDKKKSKKRLLEAVPVAPEDELQPVVQPTMTASEIKFLVRDVLGCFLARVSQESCCPGEETQARGAALAKGCFQVAS